MDEAVAEHQEATTKAYHPLAELEGKPQHIGGASAAAKPGEGSAIDDRSAVSTRKPHEPEEQRQQKAAMPSLPPMASISPKVMLRTLTNLERCPAPSDQTLQVPTLPGMLPPLSIKSDLDEDVSQPSPSSGLSRRRADKDPLKSDSRPRVTSLKTAVLAVVSAETMRDYRRSSAAMHIELLRVFVPDILIKVSTISGY